MATEFMDAIKALEGKTIAAATLMKKPKYDDEAWLKLRFTDGTEVFITAGYGGYTGGSEDEYPAYIGVADKIEGQLVEVES